MFPNESTAKDYLLYLKLLNFNQSLYSLLKIIWILFRFFSKWKLLLFKYSCAIVTDNNSTYLLKYGAADIILESSKLSLGDREIIQSNLASLAMQGIKLLGFAYKIIRKDEFDKIIIDMNWVGYIGLSDSIRPDIKNIVKDSENAGVKIKLISGDNIYTTSAIAKEVGILDEEKTFSTTGEIFHSLNLEQKKEAVKNTVVFAKTTPMQKFEILEFLKDDHEVVAMIGDGVNDAPALKLADIGVVVNEASDISKDVADIVLLDSNFKTIVNAIKEGRIIFKNIQKVVFYLLMDSFSEVLLIASSIFLGLPLALSAIQILWINLIEDTLPALSLAFEPEEKDIMLTKPVKKGAKILDRRLQILMGINVVITNGILITIQFYLSTISSNIVLNQTVIFSCLTFSSLLILFSCKDLSRNIWEYNPFSNMYLNLSILLSIIILVCSIYLPFLNKLLNTTPLSTSLLTLVFGAGISISIAFEIVKYIFQSLNESKPK